MHSVTKIAAGDYHSLALKSDGTVWAWGYNVYGQVGNGTANTNVATPIQVSGLTGVVHLSAGAYHSVAVKSDGTVWAWGYNYFGQLGNSNGVTTSNPTSSPVQVTGLTGVVEVACGDYHSMARKADGAVWCWGNNGNGQLGNNSAAASGVPVLASGMSGAISIAAGTYHSLALKADGTIWSWGYGGATQYYVPTIVSGFLGAVAVTAGEQYSLALKADGTVWAWGQNGYGRLGIEEINAAGTPTQVTRLAGIIGFSAGRSHATAVKGDSSVVAWGYSENGQLGDNYPLWRMDALAGTTAIAAGGDHTIARKEDGSVWAWGYNAFGQLGNGTYVGMAVPVKVSGLSAVTEIAAGYYHSLALKSDGTVWAWGYNGYGQVGNGTTNNNIATPVQVSGLSGVVHISAGTYHSMAVKSDGTVWAWGYNYYGQLGNSNGVTTSNPTPSPVQVTGLTGVVEVACGYYHSMARKADGAVWCWGNNGNGQLGNSTNTSSSTPVKVNGLDDALFIAAGSVHSLALKSDGTVWSWGYVWPWSTNYAAKVAGISDVTSVKGGDIFTVALKADGTVWSWGYNYNGRLGIGGNTNSYYPTKIPELERAVLVAAGRAHGFALITDGVMPIVTWNPADLTFGEPLGAAQLNATADVPGTFSYNPELGTSFDAGTRVLRADFIPADANQYIRVSKFATLTIKKAEASVSLGGLNHVFDGSAKAATATTTPGGLNTSVTYNGIVSAPAAAGSYTVAATINNPNYQGSATGTLVIAKAGASITFGNLNQSYSGAAKTVNVSTSPAGLPVTITYNGSLTPPSNAGSYSVVGSINHSSYQGSATGTLVISKAAGTVTLAGLSQTYDGSGKNATATTSPGGMNVSFTYNGSATAPTAAGSYTVVGTINNANYQGNATGTLVIDKAAATIALGNLAQTYTGTAKVASATTSPAGVSGVTVSYSQAGVPVASPTDAGSYDVSAVLSNANYVAEEATGTLVISKAAGTVTLAGLSQTYDGSGKNATATTSPGGMNVSFTYNGSATAPTAAGSYTVVGTINNANYQGNATGTLVIDKAAATIALGNLAQTYTGTAKVASATTSPAGVSGVTVSYSQAGVPVASPTDAGSYDVSAVLSNANYVAEEATGTLVISKAAGTVTLAGLSQTYDGSGKNATATTSPGGMNVSFTYNGSATAPTAAGSYTVVGTINNANYQGNATGTLVIDKAAATIALGNLAQTYTGTAKVASATTSPAGVSGVTVSYSQAGVPVASPTDAGSYDVSAVLSNANYVAEEATGTLVISKAAGTVTLAGLSQTYDGSGKNATATTSPGGMNVSFTYNGSATAPTAAGSYTVVGTINNANYQGNATGTLVIDKATPILAWQTPEVIGYGTALSATQLNASSDVPGSFTYSPAVGTVVVSGTQTLSATFAPADAANYKAGNVQVSLAVTPWNWSGFLQPVDNLPTVNRAKAGSAIPVKFSLGGSKGLAIFAAGYPAAVQITDTGASASDIEQTVTAGSSSLSYDPATDQYTYVWKTNSTWANTSRQLILKLADGTTRTANFKFTK